MPANRLNPIACALAPLTVTTNLASNSGADSDPLGHATLIRTILEWRCNLSGRVAGGPGYLIRADMIDCNRQHISA